MLGILGVITVDASRSRVPLLHWLAWPYRLDMRGTPPIVQIFFIYYGANLLLVSDRFPTNLSIGSIAVSGAVIAGIIALGLNEAAYRPCAALVPFDTEQEAITLANDTAYRLAASVWTTDLSRGHRVAARMRVGISWVNTWFLRDLRSPFGGVGPSGIGREGGEHSLDFCTEPTNVCVRL